MSQEKTKSTEPQKENNEEKGSKKRDWIKNIAIIFLAVMLVLTFFSNTIMNYSLPKVSTALVQTGNIKSQVRGKGIIEIVDPYNVEVNETRTISAVVVKEGSEVHAGDVIYRLKGEESTEMEQAKKDLLAAQTEYKKDLLDGTISAQANGGDVDTDSIRRTIASYDSTINGAKAEAANHEAAISNLQRQLEDIGQTSASAYWSAQLVQKERSKELAEGKKTEAEGKKTAAESKKSGAEAIKESNQTLEDEYQAAISAGDEPTDEQTIGHGLYEAAVADITAAEKEIEAAAKEIETQEKDIANLVKSIDEVNYQINLATANGGDINQGKINGINAAIRNEKAAKEAAEKRQKDAEDKKADYVKDMSGRVTATEVTEKINNLQEKVAKMEKEALGGEITAPVDGTIVKLAKTTGETTEPKEVVAVIQVAGKGFCTKISVDTKQARSARVGDEVEIEDYYYYGVTANLVSIVPDKDNPKDKRTLNFDLEGPDLMEGGSISLAVGSSSSSYELVVPKSALNEDNKGHFVMTLVSKSVPFGTRYVAKRVDVSEIYATDDSNAAIEADIDPWGVYVITNSTKPIKPGEQVRLADEQ